MNNARLFCRPKIGTFISVRTQTTAIASQSVQPDLLPPKIKLPNRIKRSPTALLEALAKTVGQDETASDYTFIDDPYLLPNQIRARQIFTASKESGRRAAKHVAAKFAPLFRYEQDEPRIAAFRQHERQFEVDKRQAAAKESPDDEKLLLECLDAGMIAHAAAVYERLHSAGVNLDTATAERLLSLLAFHNNQDAVGTQFRELSFYSGSQMKLAWSSDGAAELLFGSLKAPKSAAAYSAMIRGMTKYGEFAKALKLFDEMRHTLDPNSIKDVHLFDAVLKCMPATMTDPSQVWNASMALLSDMNRLGLRPTVRTFNTILETVCNSPFVKEKSERLFQTFREMKILDIKPSPASLYFLLRKNEHADNLGSLIEFSLSCLEHDPVLEILDERDFQFFPFCMTLIDEKLHSKSLAYRLNTIVNKPEAPLFLNHFTSRETFYTHFVNLLSMYEEPGVFLNYFESIFPHIFTPKSDLLAHILNNLNVTGANVEAIRLYPAIVSSGNLIRGSVRSALISCLYHATDVNKLTIQQLGDIAFDIKQKTDSFVEAADARHSFQRPFYWHKKHIEALATICERAGQLERSKIILATKNLKHTADVDSVMLTEKDSIGSL